MEQAEMARTLGEVERLRERTRDAVEWGWFPFLVFGVAVLLSAPFAWIDDGRSLGVYWLVAGPIALAVTLYAIRSLEVQAGVLDRHELVYAVVIAAMVAGAIVVGWTAEGIASDVGHMFPIGAGLLVIAAIDRSVLVAATGAAILALGALFAIIEPAHADGWVALSEGAVLIAAGLAARRAATSESAS
jgi:hypothetical protein